MPTVCTLVLQANPPSINFDPHRDNIHPNVSNPPSDPEHTSHPPPFSPVCSDCLRRTKPYLVTPESHSPSLTDGVIYCHDSQSSKPDHASSSRIIFTVSIFFFDTLHTRSSTASPTICSCTGAIDTTFSPNPAAVAQLHHVPFLGMLSEVGSRRGR